MTRKHYIALAAALRAARPDEPSRDDLVALSVWLDTVRCIADALAADNPRFDRERFYAAAGMVQR